MANLIQSVTSKDAFSATGFWDPEFFEVVRNEVSDTKHSLRS